MKRRLADIICKSSQIVSRERESKREKETETYVVVLDNERYGRDMGNLRVECPAPRRIVKVVMGVEGTRLFLIAASVLGRRRE